MYAPASRCAPNFAKAAHLSGFHFALARPLLSPTKCPRYAVVLCGDPVSRGAFAHFIEISRSSVLALVQDRSQFPPLSRAISRITASEHDENSFEDGTTRRSAKRSQAVCRLLNAAARPLSAEQRRKSKKTRALTCERRIPPPVPGFQQVQVSA